MKKISKSMYAIVSTFALVAVSFQSCTESRSENVAIPKLAEAIPVKVIPVISTQQYVSVSATGQLTTESEAVLGFKVGGVIGQLHVKEGDHVKKGQLLAILDQTEVNSFVAQATLGVEKSRRDYERVSNLYRDSVATLEQMQNVKTALDIATEQLQSARFNQQFSKVTAPADGYILKKFVSAGQVIGAGDPVFKVNQANESSWILKVNVSDKQWSQIELSDLASVHVDAIGQQALNGKVVRKSESADPFTGTFFVEIQITDPARLATGMFGAAEIKTRNRQQGWRVPFEAVLDANGNEGFVFVTSDGRTAKKQKVSIVSFDQKEIMIGDGLADATSVIVSGSAYLNDNSPIKIIK